MNKLADIFTPQDTADQLAATIWPEIVAAYRRLRRPIRILDPGAGTGNLTIPLIALAKRDNIPLKITMVEIQLDYARTARYRLRKKKVKS